MRACCNGADFIISEDDCNIYCKVVGQTQEQLRDCLGRMAGTQGNVAGVICSSDAATRSGKGLFGWTIGIGILVVIFMGGSL
jgi:hypothetical protein